MFRGGLVIGCKERLYIQTHGIDYQETFVPVGKMNFIRVIPSLATNELWPLYQFDVKNSFFHGVLHEELYMKVPSGS